jgi:serine/threonine protein kinase
LGVGATVAGYMLEDVVGRGGEATVFRANDPADPLAPPVAIKIFHDRERVESALNEGRTIARLRHPHILRVHKMGLIDGALFIALAYASGGSLRDRVRRDGPLELAEAVRRMRGVANALCMAHEAGVVHRDVHAGNVLIDADGEFRLADFGLSRKTRAAINRRSVVGWPGAIAPEIWQGLGAGPAADVYAFGVCLHFAATGMDLVSSKLKAAEQRRRHLESDLAFAPQLDPAFRKLLGQMTRRMPQNRPNMAQVATRLAELDATSPGGAVHTWRDWRAIGFNAHLMPSIVRSARRIASRVKQGSQRILLTAPDGVWRQAWIHALSKELLRVGRLPTPSLHARNTQEMFGPCAVFIAVNGFVTRSMNDRWHMAVRMQGSDTFIWIASPADRTHFSGLVEVPDRFALVPPKLKTMMVRLEQMTLVSDGVPLQMSPDARLLIAKHLIVGLPLDRLLRAAEKTRRERGLPMITTWCIQAAESAQPPPIHPWPSADMVARLASLRSDLTLEETH